MLEYNTPFAGCGSFPCVGGSANVVFGQAGSFTSLISNHGGLSADSLLRILAGLAVDASGNLYIADNGNNRILEYNTPLSTDTTADMVFGQGGNFTTGTCDEGGTSADSLFALHEQVALDSSGQSLRRRRNQQPRARIRHPAHKRTPPPIPYSGRVATSL